MVRRVEGAAPEEKVKEGVIKKEPSQKLKEKEEEGVFTKGVKALGEGLESVPLVGGVFRGAERLALEGISATGRATGINAFEKEEIEKSRRELGLNKGNIFLDPDVQSLGLAALTGGIGAGIARKGATATIGFASQLGSKAPVTAVRSFVGKPASSGISKLFAAGGRTAKNTTVTARFATNKKSQAITQSLLTPIFRTAFGGPKRIMAAVGTYPFAGFIKEEAVQTLGFASSQAERSGNLQAWESAVQEEEELLNPGSIQQMIGLIPYANLGQSLLDFFSAAEVQTRNSRDRLEAAKSKQVKGGI